jgi:hypothetical protein
MAKRGMQSPDDADAISMTFAAAGKVADLYRKAMRRV